MTGFVLALFANIPLLAATIIFAILMSGTSAGVFESLGELLVVIGPIGPIVFAAVSLVAMALGVATNVLCPGQRDGVAAIAIAFLVPMLAFGVLFLLVLF